MRQWIVHDTERKLILPRTRNYFAYARPPLTFYQFSHSGLATLAQHISIQFWTQQAVDLQLRVNSCFRNKDSANMLKRYLTSGSAAAD